MPSNTQANFIVSTKKNLVKAQGNLTNFLRQAEEKIPHNENKVNFLAYKLYKSGLATKIVKEPKKFAKNVWNNKWNYAIFGIGNILGSTAGVAIHSWGHKITWNYFYPNSSVHPFEKINPQKTDRLKIAAGFAAGPVVGLLGNYSLHKLLKYYTANHTNSFFLSGLESGFKEIDLINIEKLVSLHPDSDGQNIWRLLTTNKNYKTIEWYHLPLRTVTFFVLRHFVEPYL